MAFIILRGCGEVGRGGGGGQRIPCEANENYASSAQNNAQTQNNLVKILEMFTNIQSLPRDPSFMVLGRRMAGEELRMVEREEGVEEG